jgi:hypothetical protein
MLHPALAWLCWGLRHSWYIDRLQVMLQASQCDGLLSAVWAELLLQMSTRASSCGCCPPLCAPPSTAMNW